MPKCKKVSLFNTILKECVRENPWKYFYHAVCFCFFQLECPDSFETKIPFWRNCVENDDIHSDDIAVSMYPDFHHCRLRAETRAIDPYRTECALYGYVITGTPTQTTAFPLNALDASKWNLLEVPGEFPAQRPVTRSFDVFFVWINSWVNNGEAGDSRRYRAHYDVTVMYPVSSTGRSGEKNIQGPVSISRPSFQVMSPMLKIRRSQDRLIFNMGMPILVRRHLYIETAARLANPCDASEATRLQYPIFQRIMLDAPVKPSLITIIR